MYPPRFRTGVVLLAALAACLLGGPVKAEITAQQREASKQIEAKLIEAGRLLVKKQDEEAVKALTEAQAALVALAGGGKGADFERMVDRLMSGLKIRRRVMERRKLKLPPLPDLSKTKTKTATPSANEISFTKQIVPILTANCRTCHIQNMRGRFSMRTYNTLMQGVGGASVIQRGDAKKSRVMELLEKGEMPQGNRKLTAQQIATIGTWINQGAKFDGENPAAAISAGTPTPKQPRLEVAKATGKESIKYSRDIAPVLVENCLTCHAGRQPRGRLGLDTFARLLRGGDTGVIISPGKPNDSLLIGKLKGTAEGNRMPQGRPPLKDEVIAKFEKWIAEGAKYDGPAPDMQTTMVARIYAVSQMSHDQLAKERIGMADQNWRLANPDDKPSKHETKNFLMVGNVGEDRLKQIGAIAEKMEPKVRAMLGAKAGEPLVKGRLTMFVFNRRFDYSEYGQMVEERSIPPEWNGHWRYTIVDAYACVYPPQTEADGKLESLVAEQIAGTVIESAGDMPPWFAQGSAWEIASRIDRKDPRVGEWNKRLPDILKQMSAADDFLTNKLSAGNAAVVNYSFAKYLMSKSANYKSLLNALRGGAEFKAAFARYYRGDPNTVAKTQWARQVGR